MSLQRVRLWSASVASQRAATPTPGRTTGAGILLRCLRESALDVENLIAELKRRRVFRVLVGYGVVSFAVLQVAEPIIHALHLPDEALTYCVIALALGFPIAVVLAWAFDVSAGRIQRTPATAGGPQGTRLGLVLLGIGILAAAPGLAWYLFARGNARSRAATADQALKLKLDAVAPASEIRAPPSIAVLPFVDMSPRHDQDYFSDGVAEEILNALAQVEGLRVIGRTSSFSFKGKNEDLRTIGAKLGAANVLEGSVRTEGDRIRITAQLIEAAGGTHLWSRTFDREMKSVFAVQDEIAAAVVEALKVKLLPDRATAQKPATSPAAYEQVLLGRQLFNRQGEEDCRRSVEAYEKAIALDPDYAPAHAGLARAMVRLVNLSTTTPEARLAGQRRSLAEAERAIALAPGAPDGYYVRGIDRIAFLGDWRGPARTSTAPSRWRRATPASGCGSGTCTRCSAGCPRRWPRRARPSSSTRSTPSPGTSSAVTRRRRATWSRRGPRSIRR